MPDVLQRSLLSSAWCVGRDTCSVVSEKWDVCSFFLKKHYYRFSNKIPRLLGSYFSIFTVLGSFKSADRISDHSVLFARISAVQIGKLSGKNIFTVYFSSSSEGQKVFPIYRYSNCWGLALRTFETVPLKHAMFWEGCFEPVPDPRLLGFLFSDPK